MTCVDSSFYCKNQTVSPLWPWLPSPKHHFKRGEKQVHFWFLNTCEQFNTNTYQDLENTSHYSWADNHSVPHLFRMASLWDIHAYEGDASLKPRCVRLKDCEPSTGAEGLQCSAQASHSRPLRRQRPWLCSAFSSPGRAAAPSTPSFHRAPEFPFPCKTDCNPSAAQPDPVALVWNSSPHSTSTAISPASWNGPRSKNSIREWEGQKREPRAVGQVLVPLTGD